MYIKPTKEANGNIFDVHESAMDILLYPTNDEVPCPWDADIDVADGVVTLFGGLGPSGGSPGSHCICKVRVDDFSKYYKLEVPEDDEELIRALQEAGWVEV